MKNHVLNSDMRTGRGAFHHNIYFLKNCFVLVSLLEQVTNYLEILVLNLQVGLFNGAADLVTKHFERKSHEREKEPETAFFDRVVVH